MCIKRPSNSACCEWRAKKVIVMIFVDNEFKMKWNWNVVGPLFWQIFYTVQPNMIVWGAAEKKQLIIDWQRIHCIWLQLPQQKVLVSIWKLRTKFTRKISWSATLLVNIAVLPIIPSYFNDFSKCLWINLHINSNAVLGNQIIFVNIFIKQYKMCFCMV